MTDFVLIHGTTQNPAGWERLAHSLEVLGHRSATVDLAGDDERLPVDYAETVAGQVPADTTTPIVVAHSGSGQVLPAAARRLDARRQVWLAAYVPDGRHSLSEDVSPAPGEVFDPEWLGKDPTTDPVLAAHFLFHDCNLETLQWALTTLRLFNPKRIPIEPVALAPEIASTYIVATGDRTLRPEWCRRVATSRLDAEIIDIDSGHCPHVSQPDELAAILNQVAANATKS
jgi:pimeloyl-ACP methyl ester carboxylesterase